MGESHGSCGVHRASLGLVALLLSACSPDLVVRRFPPSGAGSVVFFTVSGEKVDRVEAVELADPVPAYLALGPLRADQSVWSLEYHCPLAALGLQAGPVVLDSRGVRLPRSHNPRVAALGAGDERWMAGQPPSAVLEAELRGTPPSPCSKVDVQLKTLRVRARVMSALGSDQVVLGDDAHLVIYNAELTATATIPFAGFSMAASFLDGTGAAVFVGPGGRIVRVDPAGQVTTVKTATRNPALFSAAAGPRDGPGDRDIYAVRGNGEALRFDGTDWKTLLREAPPTDDAVGAVWLGQGEAILLGPRRGDAIHVVGDQVGYETVLDAARGSYLFSAAYVPALGGVVLGTGDASLYVRDGPSAYHEIQVPKLGANNRVNRIVPTDDGALLSNKDGRLVELHRQLGACDALIVSGMNSLDGIYPGGPGKWILVGFVEATETSLGLITILEPPPPACD
ncbi:MAG: hypothetical protein U1E65_25060 [Myxococcota bacterium]